MILRVRVCANFEELTNESQRAVVDRVLEAWPDLERHRTVGYALRVINSRTQCGQISDAKRRIDLLVLLVLLAPLCI